jgi:hypothetical protein
MKKNAINRVKPDEKTELFQKLISLAVDKSVRLRELEISAELDAICGDNVPEEYKLNWVSRLSEELKGNKVDKRYPVLSEEK